MEGDRHFSDPILEVIHSAQYRTQRNTIMGAISLGAIALYPNKYLPNILGQHKILRIITKFTLMSFAAGYFKAKATRET